MGSERYVGYEKFTVKTPQVPNSMQIVPDHSAVLSAYPNRSIHGNHMQMTRFTGPRDPGFVAVSDKLWQWVDELETQSQTTPVPEPEPTFRSHRMIDSGGGAVFQGSQFAGGNININTQTYR